MRSAKISAVTTIKALRKEAKLTQVELARLLLTNESAISRWEGGASPTALRRIQIAEFFSVRLGRKIKPEDIAKEASDAR